MLGILQRHLSGDCVGAVVFSISGEVLNSICRRIIKLTKNWSTSHTLRKTSQNFSSVLSNDFYII